MSKGKILTDKPTLSGLILYNLDKNAHNLRFYIKRHIFGIQVFFLIIYTLLNLILAFFIPGVAIALFITVFLFVLGIERIIIHSKGKMDKDALDKKEIEIKKNFELTTDKMNNYIFALEEQVHFLERKNDLLSLKLIEHSQKSKNKR